MFSISPTIKDVARESGLSIATVSKYLNGGNVLEQNKTAIETAIDKLDFKVNELARGLKTNRTMTVGVLIPSFENIFFTSIVSTIENELLQEGYSTIVCDYQENPHLEREKLEFLLNKMVDGVILMPHNHDDTLINNALSKDIPVVLIDRLVKDLNCDVVLVDNLNASYNAVEQLIIRGHRRIGIITGPEDIYTAQERLTGYLRVHEDYTLAIDPQLIKYGNYQMQSGYDLFLELLKADPPPTAVYVTNYEMTLGAVLAINEHNVKIPDEISLIGFDNLVLARVVKPSLSIVVQPVQQIGETAARVLLKRLKNDYTGAPSIYRLKTELLMRDSVKKLNT